MNITKWICLLFCTITTLEAQIPYYIPTNGLVGWWPFNGNANDESGFNQNGVVYGAQLTTDRYGMNSKAYTFNGSSNYIEVLSTSRLSVTTSYTISTWVSVNVWSFGGFPDQHAIVSKIDNGDWYGGYEIRAIGGKQLMHSGNIGGSNFDIGKGGLSENQWYHLVVTYDGNKVRFYIDNVMQDSVSRTGHIGTSNNNLRFGRRGGAGSFNCWFNGKIDDIGIWNRSLSESEINALYLGKYCPPPDNVRF